MSLKGLNKRVKTHIYRRDNLLLRAVLHVWVARERGELLERVRRTRLGLETLGVWRGRLQEVQQLNGSVFVSRLCRLLLTMMYYHRFGCSILIASQ